MPSKILFEDGNAIVNVYAADARKLSSYYITQVTPNVAPRDMTTENLVKKMEIPQKAPRTIEETHGTHYIGNLSKSNEKKIINITFYGNIFIEYVWARA